MNKSIIEYGIDRLNDLKGYGIEAADLHSCLYNEDYFIIGTYQAKRFLEEYGIFDALEKVKDYEQDNFGKVTTDFSNPEDVANMLAYIIGEEVLNNCQTLQENWDKKLTDEQLDAIKQEMEAQEAQS